ncbi:MAG: TetR/AcrR family transcriptional repressor of nem operon [Lysobacterales bacterium]|jgi:TetR/AcrR family transcriptional repressor of nem operon
MKDCETKYKIMETAIELIWQSSYDSVGVSDICKKAKVNKGSFYHFFPSKEVLAVEAVKYSLSQFQPMLDQVFSAQKDPIQRLMDFCDFTVTMQTAKKEKIGYVCGCPFTNIGLEQSSQSKLIAEIVRKCFNQTKKYFASALKEASDSGDISIKNVDEKADELFTYNIGALTQARINNDLKPLVDLKRVYKEMLGIKREAAVGK